ncbi:MAG: hypothetical protein L0228_16030 [Planctomycetes bacterium]|nr:hypothetical protein [Planctomycetota bacterium]
MVPPLVPDRIEQQPIDDDWSTCVYLDPLVIPEPKSAALGLVALACLAASQRPNCQRSCVVRA